MKCDYHTNFLVVLGDDRGLSSIQEEELDTVINSYILNINKKNKNDNNSDRIIFRRCSIGKRPLLASQCILLVNHYLETLIKQIN